MHAQATPPQMGLQVARVSWVIPMTTYLVPDVGQMRYHKNGYNPTTTHQGVPTSRSPTAATNHAR